MQQTNEPPAGGDDNQPKSEDKKSRRSTQNQAAANEVTAAAELLSKVLALPEVLPLIAKRGYDEAELKLGQELHDKAQTGFQGRHSSLGAAQEAKEARDKAEALARGDFDDYRKTVRVRFDDPATRRAFGADGVVPADIQKFITTARAAYEAALKSSHATWLAKRSYTTERLNELLTNLKTLLGRQAAFATDKGRATGATDERDNSVSVLSAWTREFRTNVTLALKGRADLLQALGM